MYLKIYCVLVKFLTNPSLNDRYFLNNSSAFVSFCLLRCTLLIHRLRFRFLSLSLSLLSKFLRHIQRVHEFKTFFLSSKCSVCFSEKQLATQLPAEKNAVCSTGLTCVWHFTMAYIERRMGLPILLAMGGFEPSASGAPLSKTVKYKTILKVQALQGIKGRAERK